MTGQERDELVARWEDLTRRILPELASAHGWPISQDHCFMRVCLDAAAGAPWHATIRRPAIRHATVAQLRRAVDVAEGIVADPLTLADLNRDSLAGRRRARLGPA